MVREADASKVSVKIWPSHAAPALAAESTIPATRVLGLWPVSPVIPASAAAKVRLATVAARNSWTLVLTRPK